MPLTTLPTKTEDSIGAPKVDTGAYSNTTKQVPAVQWETIKDFLIAVCGEVGVHAGTAGDLNTRVNALEFPSKLDATAAPDDVTDGEAAGYRTGSIWLWAAQSRIWLFLVISPGVAGWFELQPAQDPATVLTQAIGPGTFPGDLVRVASSLYGVRKTNLGVLVDPTVDDDENNEYGTGSLWINKANGSVWVCMDPTLGAAVWRRLDVTDAWTDIAISPAAVMTPDENGRGVFIIGGTSGPAGSGTPYGGTVEIDAGAANGPGTTGGRIKLGRGNAIEVTSGLEGPGSPWTHEGDLTVVGPTSVGANTRLQVTDAQALIRVEGEIAMETPANFVVRVDGDAYFRVSSGLLELLGDTEVTGTLTRTVNPRNINASATLTVNDQVVIVDTTSGPVTLTLPNPAFCYEPILVVKKSTDANAITISAPSGQINGAASPQVLPDSTSTLRPKWSIVTDGTNTWA